jgi:hypothetical protein
MINLFECKAPFAAFLEAQRIAFYPSSQTKLAIDVAQRGLVNRTARIVFKGIMRKFDPIIKPPRTRRVGNLRAFEAVYLAYPETVVITGFFDFQFFFIGGDTFSNPLFRIRH